MGKETVFISHANPEDNIFSGWLAAKLSMEGYKVWCDLRSMTGGEDDFWGEIERTIRNEAVKFIFVASHNSITKRGTRRELALADGVSGINDFVIPVRVQDVDYSTDLPAEISRSLLIDFFPGWANGLDSLITKLKKDCVPKAENSLLLRANKFWQEGQQIVASTITSDHERHWTNWFPLELPEYVYFSPNTFEASPCPSQITTIAGFQYSFTQPHTESVLTLFGQKEAEAFIKADKFSTQIIINEYRTQENTTAVNIYDSKKAIVQLCNRLIEHGLQTKGLMVYPRTTGPNIYYVNRTLKVPMKRYGRHFRNLCGSSGEFEWHYGVSISTVLDPILHVVFKNHVIFTKNGQLLDSNRQASARRHVCRMWFNDRWRDLLLAFSLYISDDPNASEPRISIDTGSDEKIVISSVPLSGYSTIGYIEPTHNGVNTNEID